MEEGQGRARGSPGQAKAGQREEVKEGPEEREEMSDGLIKSYWDDRNVNMHLK